MKYAVLKTNVVQNVIQAPDQPTADLVAAAFGGEAAVDIGGAAVDQGDIYNPGTQKFTSA